MTNAHLTPRTISSRPSNVINPIVTLPKLKHMLLLLMLVETMGRVWGAWDALLVEEEVEEPPAAAAVGALPPLLPLLPPAAWA